MFDKFLLFPVKLQNLIIVFYHGINNLVSLSQPSMTTLQRKMYYMNKSAADIDNTHGERLANICFVLYFCVDLCLLKLFVNLENIKKSLVGKVKSSLNLVRKTVWKEHKY